MSQNPLLLSFLLIFLGLVSGGLIGWLLCKLLLFKNAIPLSQLTDTHVLKPVYDLVQKELVDCKALLQEKNLEIQQLIANHAVANQVNQQLEEKLEQQQWESAEWHSRSLTTFENLANQILEEKTQKFTSQNLDQITSLLHPLKEKINQFEAQIEKRYLEETIDRGALKYQVEQLKELNIQLSQDANNLALALKGNSKVQGDWGEIQLELLLEKAGLEKGVHFQVQSSFQDENGRQKRPDFIIHLPAKKHIIVDAKVSLKDYEQFFNSGDEPDREKFIKAHVASIRQHIKSLSSKNYQHLYQINSPDYTLLYIPMEPAYAMAIQQDPKLFLDALEFNVIIVTNSTLLATLRTIAYIWKQEKQKNNVLEIARQGGLLYDKFCAFVEDLREVGQKIGQAETAYQKALNKLTTAEKKGDTLIARAEKIKTLGAKTSRQLPDVLLDQNLD